MVYLYKIKKEITMKSFKIFLIVSTFLLVISPACFAGDFDWVKDFNIKAEADPSGFKASLGARFKIGDAEIEAVLNDVKKPADAYMIFRLGEMSNKPISDVVKKYKTGKSKGWGNIAKGLGIKPGSEEFHALKSNHDLSDRTSGGKDNDKSKDKDRSKDKNKGKKK
jgi:hypothetical protein